MEKLDVFEIILTNMTGVYHDGDILEGQVILELNKPMQMRGIKLHYTGEASVHWSEKNTDNEDDMFTKQYDYTNTEKYFDEVVHFLTHEHSNHKHKLETGRHTFPFQYQLPLGLPSTFEDTNGHVRYLVSCTIDRPWKVDFKTWHPFTVTSYLDLNMKPNCMQRQTGTRWKQFCCLWCKSGPIEATFHINRQGYVPGEAIKLNAEISNSSNKKMKLSYVDLIMKKTFHATTLSKIEWTQIARCKHPSISSHSEDVWKGDELVIPPLPPSFLTGCKIIDINYVVQLSIEPSGPYSRLTIPLDIIIGSVPLACITEDHINTYLPSTDREALDFSEMSLTPSLRNDNSLSGGDKSVQTPVTQYKESFFGPVAVCSVSSSHNRGKKQYTPMYPYYDSQSIK
ncbi:unnamed protein product [Lymnaea stagnalis]|uniref:Arrestin C-terminal-like domain-containing protein n=1 Tax=Lymnaea stagnalis TaxID=6523 RepID=A0AAV2H9S5_LYMST